MIAYYEEAQVMALLKLKRHAQVTIPADLCRQFHLQEGDYLEAEAVEGGILLKPVSGQAREQAWQQMRAAMAEVVDRAPVPCQSDREKEEEITRWVKDARTRPDA